MSLNLEELQEIPELISREKFSCFIKGKSLYFAYKFGNFYFFNNKNLEKKVEGFKEHLLVCRAFLKFLKTDTINLNSILIKFVVFEKFIQICSLSSYSNVRITEKKIKRIFEDFENLKYGNFFFFKDLFTIDKEKILELREMISKNADSNSLEYLKDFLVSNLKSRVEDLELKHVVFYSNNRDIVFWL